MIEDLVRCSFNRLSSARRRATASSTRSSSILLGVAPPRCFFEGGIRGAGDVIILMLAFVLLRNEEALSVGLGKIEALTKRQRHGCVSSLVFVYANQHWLFISIWHCLCKVLCRPDNG